MRLAIIVAALVGLSGPAYAIDPVTGTVHSFFHYRKPPYPAGGNCAAIAAAAGPGSTWYGEFSGRRLGYNHRYQAFGARGCFDSEAACRVWQQQALNYAFGTISYTRCRPGDR